MERYDFVVVGAGSAGCAVAGPPSDSAASVLLIEAGGTDRRFTIRAPLMYALQFGTSLDWAYETEPEPGCADRKIALPRGLALGGTSSMNGMVWVKGSSLDYDGWSAGLGVVGRRTGVRPNRTNVDARHSPARPR